MGDESKQVDDEENAIPDGRFPKSPNQVVGNQKHDAHNGQPSKHPNTLDGIGCEVDHVGHMNQHVVDQHGSDFRVGDRDLLAGIQCLGTLLRCIVGACLDPLGLG